MSQQIDNPCHHVAPPQAALFQMIVGCWVSQMISIVARLGIADLLAGGPRGGAELARAAGTDADALRRVLRALAGLGIFAEGDPGVFELTPTAEYLRAGVPGSLRAMAVMVGEDWHYRTWGQALHSLRTGQTTFTHVFNEEPFDYLARRPDEAATFHEAMTGFSAAGNPAVAAAYDFSGGVTVVDVGGGHGSLLADILEANPEARGILFDQPHVVAGARPHLEARGVAGRCELVGGDFFETVPRGGDFYLVKHVIHDWAEEQALRILRNCHRAMDAGSRLLLVEHVIEPGNGPSFGKLLDVEMLIFAGGRERTGEEYRALLAAAGFELTNVIPAQCTLSLIEAVKS